MRSVYEISYLLQSEESSAGGVLAFITGRALLNKLPPMVDRRGLLLGSGVRVMSYNCSSCVIRGIGLCFHISVGDRESEQTLCGDCLRLDCHHLEEARA